VFSASQLNALNISQEFIFAFFSNVVTKINLKKHPAGSPFRVIVHGVKNPNLISEVTTGWSVYNILVLIMGNLFFSNTTSTSFESGYLIF